MTKSQVNGTTEVQVGMVEHDPASFNAENPNNLAIVNKLATTVEKESVDAKTLMNEIFEVQSIEMDEKDIAYAAQEQAKEEQEKTDGLWEIRARFKNLAATILPKHPYLPSIPSKVRIPTQEGPDWRKGTNFSPHEERVQYASFQPLIDDDAPFRHPTLDPRSPQLEPTRRTSSEISEQAPRKKWSLEEYTRLDKAGSAALREGSMFPNKAEAKFSPKGNTGPKAEPSLSPRGSTMFKIEAMTVEGGIIAPKAQGNIPVAHLENGIKVESKDILKKDVTKRKEVSTQQETATQKEATAPKKTPTQKEAAIDKEPTAQNEAAQREISMQKDLIKGKEATPARKGATSQTAAISRRETTTQREATTQKEATAQKLNAGQIIVNREDMVAIKNEVGSEKVVNLTEGEPTHSRKRPIEEVVSATSTKFRAEHEVVRPSKKARISPSPTTRYHASSPKQINSHEFPPLLSPTLPPSIEAELAKLNFRANAANAAIAEIAGSVMRIISSRKELPKPDATFEHIPPIPLSVPSKLTSTPHKPGTNGPKSKIAEAAQNSMFFGQPRRTPQPRKALVNPEPKQNAKKPDVIPKTEETRTKTAELANAKGQPKGNAKKPELSSKSEGSRSKVTEHADAKGQLKGNPKKPDLITQPDETSSKLSELPNLKRPPKEVGGDLKEPALAVPNSASERLEKESLIVILKIPRSKRKACQALLRFSPRPRKANALQAPPAAASKEQSNVEAPSNVMEMKARKGQSAQKRPVAAATETRQESVVVKPNNRGQKRPPPVEKEDSEPLKKRSKTSSDGDNQSMKRPQPVEKEDSVSSTKHSALPKDPHDRVEKRPRPTEKDDPEPLKKRSNLSDDVDSSQPLPRSSNTPKSNSAPKSYISTPKGDVKSATMRRIASRDGEAKTPSAALREGTPTVPGSAERASRDGRPSSSAVSTALSEEAALWRAEQQKYLELGKRLKYELDGTVKKDGVLMEDPAANKRGCPTGVESILCYMLGFTALDELGRMGGKPGNSSAWETLLHLIDYVKLITSSASHIYGLILQLEGICRDTIHSHDLERLDREPSAASPEFTGKLVENARSAHKAWLAGTTGLSVNDLQKSFPKTWAKRAGAPAARNGQEKLVPGKFAASGFYLPLASTSTAVEAVKMGWMFLAEWAEMEGVEWKGRMF